MHGTVAVVTAGLVAATPRHRRPLVARSRSAARRWTGGVLAPRRTSGSFHGDATSECGDDGYRFAGGAVAQRSAGCATCLTRAPMVGGHRCNRVDGVLWILCVTEQPVAAVRGWVVAGLVGCLALALAYLPPRGAASSGSPFFVGQSPSGTPARLRAQALADEWRTADGSLHLLTARRRLQQLAQTAIASGRSLVVVSESAGAATATPLVADSAARLAWQQLGLSGTKVSVALVIQLMSVSSRRDRVSCEPA